MADPSLEPLQSLAETTLTEVRDLRGDVQALTVRIGRLEEQVAGLHVDYAGLSVRMDRFGERLQRLEARAGLLDAH